MTIHMKFCCMTLPNIQPSKAITLLLLAVSVYICAMNTNWWFTIPPHSFYGLFSVTFCDFLHCQLIPAFGDSPSWYVTVQVLSVLGLLLSFLAIAAVLSQILNVSKASGLCVLSATFKSTALIVFYTQLITESSPKYHPKFSYSSGAVCLACLMEICAAALLTKSGA